MAAQEPSETAFETPAPDSLADDVPASLIGLHCQPNAVSFVLLRAVTIQLHICGNGVGLNRASVAVNFAELCPGQLL